MKHLLKKATTLAIATLASSTLFAQEEVLHIDLNLFADFNYDVDGFDVKEYINDDPGYTNQDFEDDYPIFAGAADYEAYGFGSFEYFFDTLDIAPTFDLDEKYDWEISFLGDWGYDIETEFDTDSDYGDIDFEFPISQTSVSEVTLGLTGLNPADLLSEIMGFFAPLPGSGTMTDLLAAINSIHGLGLSWPLVSIDSDDIEYYTDFDMPFGYVDVAIYDTFSIPQGAQAGPVDQFLDSLLYANAGAEIDIHIKATRQNQAVPDTGSTALLALFGMAAMLAAKRRLNR